MQALHTSEVRVHSAVRMGRHCNTAVLSFLYICTKHQEIQKTQVKGYSSKYGIWE